MPHRRLRFLAARAALTALWFPAVTSLHAGGVDCAIQSSSVFLEPVGTDPDGTFGDAVAVDGDWIAVAAPGGAPAAGRVELFHRIGDTWTHHSIVTPLDGALDDRFGQAVCLRGDTLLVGASNATGAAPTSGAAYVFRLTGDQWVQESKLVASDGQPMDLFGRDLDLDLDLDGDIAVIGARQHDALGANAGAAYVFERSGDAWCLQQKLTAPDGAAGDIFGYAVQVDRGTIAVSAPFDDVDGDTNHGSVHIFDHVAGQWAQSAQLALHDPTTGLLGVQLQFRNDTLLTSVGGPPTFYAAAALAYQRHEGRWGLPQLVTIPPYGPSFSRVLALGPDGASAVRSAPLFGGVLSMIWRDEGLWTTEQFVTPPSALPGPGDFPVAFDGETVVGGRRQEQVDGAPVGQAFAAAVPPRDRDHNGLDDACELAIGLAEDCDRDGIVDGVQVPFRFMAGTAPPDESWQISQNVEVVILNRFVTTADGQAVRSLNWFRPAHSASQELLSCAVALVYSDPDGDGAPLDAKLLRAQAVVLPGTEPDAWVTVPFEEVELGPAGTSFFVGLYFPVPTAPVASSEGQIPHRQTSWWIADALDPIDLENLDKSDLRPWEWATPYTFASVILLSAELSDCDDSGRLDPCEIADGTLEDADGDGVPDACPSLIVDLDGDGIPDTCMPPPEFDLDGNFLIDGADVGLLLGQWGPCPEAPEVCSADFNGDGVVDGADLGALLGAWGAL